MAFWTQAVDAGSQIATNTFSTSEGAWQGMRLHGESSVYVDGCSLSFLDAHSNALEVCRWQAERSNVTHASYARRPALGVWSALVPLSNKPDPWLFRGSVAPDGRAVVLMWTGTRPLTPLQVWITKFQ